MKPSRQFTIAGEKHRVFKRGNQVYVDHVGTEGGKYDVINLTQESGAKSVESGVDAVKKYHSKNSRKK